MTSLIGIKGDIGAGKNEVARIIRYLTSLNSHMVYSTWIDHYQYPGHSPWEERKFAGKLKQIASLMLNVPVEKFEDQDFKNQLLPDEWQVYEIWQGDIDEDWKTSIFKATEEEAIRYCEKMGKNHFSYKKSERTYRWFLQNLGTEALRNVIHPNVHVLMTFADYSTIDTEAVDTAMGMEPELVDVYPKWIITDLRFPNEREAIVSRNGITIKVNRPGIPKGTHDSETSLDNAVFAYTIENDSTIDALIEKVREILIKEHIL